MKTKREELLFHIILFFSSRDKIRISLISVSRNRLRTALPKEPAPQVINNVLFLNSDTYNFNSNVDILYFFDAI